MAEQTGSVLVIGATGQQGGAAARALLERGRAVRALVRDETRPAARRLRDAGASLVTGDLDDRGSVRAAMSSVSGVFLALTMMTGPRITLDGVAAEQRRAADRGGVRPGLRDAGPVPAGADRTGARVRRAGGPDV